MALTVSNTQTLEDLRVSHNDLVDDVGGIGSLRTGQKSSLVDAVNSIIDEYFYFQDYEYTASGGSNENFTGADNDGNTLKYSVGRVLVFKNGLLLKSGSAYSATNGSSVQLVGSSSSGDVIRITSFTGSYEGTAAAAQQTVHWTKSSGVIYNSNASGIVINSDDTNIITTPAAGYSIQLESTGDDVLIETGASNKVKMTGDLDVVGDYKKNGSALRVTDLGSYAADVRAQLSASGDISYNSSTGVISFSAGTSSFTGLTDSPANYTGAALKYVRVNSGGTGVEFDELSNSDWDHDSLANFVANEHIDWTASGAGTIHASNYTDTNTTYSAGTNMSLSGTTFSSTDTNTWPSGGSAGQFWNHNGAYSTPPDTNTTYSAGSNMSLSGTTFSATNTTYSAGANMSLSGTTFSATDTNTWPSGGSAGEFWNHAGNYSTPPDTNTTYSAGTNMSLSGTTFSAVDTTYSAGSNVAISGSNVISATNTTYSAGTNMTLSGTTFAATDTNTWPSGGSAGQFWNHSGAYSTPPDTNTTYSAGTGMSLSGTTFNCTVVDTNTWPSGGSTGQFWSQASGGSWATPPDTNTTYSAGSNMSLSGTTFSATNTTYSAGSNMSLSGTTFSATNTTYSAGTGMSLSGTTFNCTIDTPAEVGLGNLSSSGNALSGSFTATGDITAYSDIALKKNLSPIDNALDKVLSLTGYEFDWKKNAIDRIGLTDRHQVGLVAQEIEKVLPEAATHTDGHMGINYLKVIPLLIESIKELKSQLDSK